MRLQRYVHQYGVSFGVLAPIIRPMTLNVIRIARKR